MSFDGEVKAPGFVFESDLHTHTRYSHGKGTVEDNVKAGIEKGLRQIGIAEHGPRHLSFGVRRGKFAELKAEITRLRLEYTEIEILFGIEANIIGPEGVLDIRPDEYGVFDYVCAGWHFGTFDGMTPAGVARTLGNFFRRTVEKAGPGQVERNTAAIVRAVERGGIKFLTHPGDKAPVDMLRVAEACAGTGTLLEINTRHMSLTPGIIERILPTGVMFIVSSDAHSPNRVGSFDEAAKLIREAGIDAERVVNLKKLQEGDMQVVVISGLSGAGKSLAVDVFEDMGYYCIDNLPPPLIKDFITLIKGDKHKLEKVALVIDIRGGDFLNDYEFYSKALNKRNISHKLIFLEASKLVLLKRFSETRRQHPLAAGKTNGEAIDEEIERLAPIKEMSDLIVDTSSLKSGDLAQVLRDFIQDGGQPKPFRFIIQSFGYKYGMPDEADFILDMRFIPNPFYEPGMRELTGKDEPVREFVMGSEDAVFFADEIFMLLERLKPSYIKEGKASVNVAFGCTGGQHRSVAMAIHLAERLRETGENVTLRHREV